MHSKWDRATHLPRVSLIGVSGYGAEHFERVVDDAQKGLVKIVAATIVNCQQEVEKCAILKDMGAMIFSDFQAMLERVPSDLCIISTGIHLHAEMVIEALKRGINVFVEKPACATVEQLKAMKQAEIESGCFVCVGYQGMYTTETHVAKEMLLNGFIGRVHSMSCRGMWPRPISYYERNSWAGRLFAEGRSVMDSPFNNAFAHHLNLLLFLAGGEPSESALPEEVEANLYRAYRIESCDTAFLRIKVETGIQISMAVTHASTFTLDPEIQIEGTEGVITWDPVSILYSRYDGKREVRPCLPVDGIHRKMLNDIYQRLSNPKVFVCGLNIAGAQVVCAEKIRAASTIETLSPRFLVERIVGEEKFVSISGIEEKIQKFFFSGPLLEMELP